MNRARLKRIAIAVAILGLSVALTGCGSNNNNNAPPPPAAVPAPLPAAPPVAACVPISAPIPFTMTNIYFDNFNIVGGLLPYSSQPVGQVVLAGPLTGGPYQRLNGVDGSISMNVIPVPATAALPPMPYPGYPNYTAGYGMTPSPYYGGFSNVTNANGNGVLTISSQTQMDISNYFGGGGYAMAPGYGNAWFGTPGGYGYQYPFPYYSYPPGYPSGYPPTPAAPTPACVSGLAINVGHANQTGEIYGGKVYLYMNNTQHGYALDF